MFPTFKNEKSNYLACWKKKNVFKGKVNLEKKKYI